MNPSRTRTTLDRRIAPQPGEVIDRWPIDLRHW